MSNRIFSQVKVNRPKRNVFDLSHENKLSMNMGKLVPILCQEVVPGDSFRMNTEVFIRMAPMVAPVMHRINVYTHFFFVPNRLVWDKWKDFITGGNNPGEVVPFPAIPVNLTVRSKISSGTLGDYLGIQASTGLTNPNGDVKISSLPFRAYQLIYNEFYRDQNLQNPIDFSIGDYSSADENSLLTLRDRCWEKDYFTSALPWAQKGGDVTLPGAGGEVVLKSGPLNPTIVVGRGASHPAIPSASNFVSSNPQSAQAGTLNHSGVYQGDANNVVLDPNGNYVIGEGSGSTINDLRRSIKVQEWLERNARGGSRYIEQILSHFGVRSSDARLQRPEYLGGGKSPVVISEVLQTSQTEQSGTPQGNMSGHGVAVGNSHSFKKFFEEHGYIIGIMSVLPRTAYMTGLPRHFSKFDRFDYFWPSFAHLGEQEVKNKEIACDFAQHAATFPPEGTFGYQSRYAEYKFGQSQVHGEFRNSLKFWHMGRSFDFPNTIPALNSDFVTAQPTNDIFAVTDPNVHHLYVQLFNNIQAIRPMPKFGTPIL